MTLECSFLFKGEPGRFKRRGHHELLRKLRKAASVKQRARGFASEKGGKRQLIYEVKSGRSGWGIYHKLFFTIAGQEFIGCPDKWVCW